MALLSGIVVFSVSMDTVEASFKMNQNKSEEDQRKVIASLTATGCPFDRDVARVMSKSITEAERDETQQPLSAALFTCSSVVPTSTP